MDWTPEQLRAIEADGTNVLVAAAAGAGKTATLVARVIHRVLGGTDLDRLLVVTFTEAAAAEMRQRIARELQAALSRQPASTFLRRQLALLDRAQISTLHSFCLGLVRQNFYRLGLDPAVRVADEPEAALLRQDALDSVFETWYAAPDPAPFLELVDRYGGLHGDWALRERVEALWAQAVQTPWPEVWLEQTVRRFESPRDHAGAWVQPVLGEAARRLERAAGQIRWALRLCALPRGSAAYRAVLARDLGQVEALLQRARAGDWEGLRQALRTAVFDRLPSVRAHEVDEALKRQVQELRDRVKGAVRGLIEEEILGRPLQELLEEAQALAPYVRTLVALVRDLDRAYTSANAARGQVDFHDLERLALRVLLDPDAPPGVLRPSGVALEVRDRFEAVLVDEYQDINPLQDAILTLASRGGEGRPGNLFMVGDVKQGIYRFRHAEPGLFLEKYRTFVPWQSLPSGDRGGEAPAPAYGLRIDLQANFRSRPAVLHAVNFLFRQIMRPGVAEMGYDADAELVPGATYPEPPVDGADTPPGEGRVSVDGPPVEVYIIAEGPHQRDEQGAGTELEGGARPDADTPGTVDRPETGAAWGGGAGGESDPDQAAAEEERERTALEREAMLAARRVHDLLEQRTPVWDPGQRAYRPVRPRDVAVLLRATRSGAAAVVAAFQEQGLPVHADAGSGYFETVEIQTVLSLLSILDNPRQDIPLAAVLRSGLVGLGTEDLARVRLAAPGGDFYDAVCAAAGVGPVCAGPAPGPSLAGAPATGASIPEALAGRLQAFLNRLVRWRALARRLPLSRLLWLIYEETGLLHHSLTLPGGAQRHANLLALHDRARQFDQFARQGLFRFLRFVERLREGEADEAEASPLGEGADVIRVMSIHKAKGLEFPVVFVLGLGRRFNLRDSAGDLLIHRELGVGPRVVDPVLQVRYPSLAHRGVALRLVQEALAEEMRVLYVALTRARERLVLTGTLRFATRALPAWLDLAGSHVGWALPDGLLAGASCCLDWIGPALCRHRDGEPLWRWAQAVGAIPGGVVPGVADGSVAADPSRWHVAVVTPEGVAAMARAGPVGRAGSPAAVPAPLDDPRVRAALERLEPLPDFSPGEDGLVREVARRLSWRYPRLDLTRRRAKVTVTGLLRSRADVPDPNLAAPGDDGAGPTAWAGEEGPEPARLRIEAPARPRFLQGSGRPLTAAEVGTAVHRVLQHLDLRAPLDAGDVARQVEILVEREILTPQEAAAIDIRDVVRFFTSPLGQRLKRAPDRVQREVALTAGVSAHAVFPDLDPAVAGGERVVLQGAVDCVLEEADGSLVVIDFKTDRALPGQVREVAARYEEQVRVYARILADILRRPVSEAWLYFLRAGEAVPVELVT